MSRKACIDAREVSEMAGVAAGAAASGAVAVASGAVEEEAAGLQIEGTISSWTEQWCTFIAMQFATLSCPIHTSLIQPRAALRGADP